MSCNPCCCNLKDSAVTIGIWSVVFAVAQLGIMGWQMAAIKYEKDRAANTLLPNYNTYGKYDIPSYYESYWQSPEERYYIGLFIVQVLCLISVFFLLFAAVAMIWGVHTWSKYLIWPWFPCMICSILSSLAYCITWWAGDVRDYWLALTIIEIIGVFVNIYCVVVAFMYYRKIDQTTKEYEGKARASRRGRGRPYSSRRDLLELDTGGYPPEPPRGRSPYPTKSPYPNYSQPLPAQPLHQSYPSPYSPTGIPQTPLPLPPSYTPYPVDPNEVLAYKREPKKPSFDSDKDDPVKAWVKTQQKVDRGEANSEPISPIREEPSKGFPIQHSRSVPSMFDGSLVSHKDCDHGRHHHHRSSSRRKRSKSRHRDRSPQYSSDSETRTDFDRDRKHRSSSRHRHRSKSRYSESEFTATTDHRDRDRDRHRDRDRDRRHREDDGRRSSKRHRSRRREEEDDRDLRRKHRHKERKEEEKPIVQQSQQEPDNAFPGFVVPQHIVIPPSSGERGPDGQPLPQKFQINSEITINYDQNNGAQPEQEPYRRRFAPMQITSNV